MQPLSFESLLGLLTILGLGLIGLKARAMDIGGLSAGVVIGYIILIGGGWSWFILIALFFLIASQCTRFRFEYKRSLGVAQEKGGARGWQNTVANGGVAAAAALGEYFFASRIFSVMFLGAVSTAMADTLATEIGLLSKRYPRLITNPRLKVSAGTSGGVTPLGLTVALLAPSVVGVGGGMLHVLDTQLGRIVLISTVGGFVGSLADSLLGASIQGINRCRVCGYVTEGPRHHGMNTETIRGLHAIDNNVVNLLATVIGALTALALYYYTV